MKTKIAGSSGFVFALVIGALATMVALGVFTMPSVFAADVSGPDAGTADSPDVTISPVAAGAAARYTIKFEPVTDLVAGADTIIIQFEDDVKMPSVLDPSTITIIATRGTNRATNVTGTMVANPISATVELVGAGTSLQPPEDQPEVTLLIPDMGSGEDGNQGILATAGGSLSNVTVIFTQAAGIKNPTEGTKNYTVRVRTSQDATTANGVGSESYNIPIELILNDNDGNRGANLTAIGKGFQNGTTATVWLDEDNDGTRDSGETILGTAVVASDDTFVFSFTVNVPPFNLGTVSTWNSTSPVVGNYIRAIDGQDNTDCVNDTDCTTAFFIVDGLMAITPKTAAIGDTVTVTLKDWPTNTDPTAASDFTIGGVNVFSTTALLTAAVTLVGGEDTFTFEVPDGVTLGVQEIKFKNADESDDQKITILGSPVELSPDTVVPNQTVTMQGRGFTKSGFIDNDATGGSSSKITIGGTEILEANIDDDKKVEIDSSGNWVASVVIPVSNVTSEPGTYDLKAFDNSGREGLTSITILPRVVSLSPPESRLGSNLVITGAGFPARNTESDQDISITVKYSGSGFSDRSVTVTPNASGEFTSNIAVPLGASIPSTNTVTVEYKYTEPGTSTETTVTETLSHKVPGAEMTIEPSSGFGGVTATLIGTGFKGFTSASVMKISDLDVLPSPAPSTKAEGTFTQEFTIPQLDTGIHSVKITIGNVTASVGFTVLASVPTATPSPAAAAAAPAVALKPLIDNNENLLRVWHFDPASQDVGPDFGWFLYDPRPVFAAANSVDEIAPGKFYWVNVREGQVAVLGGTSRDLFGGWNPVTW